MRWSSNAFEEQGGRAGAHANLPERAADHPSRQEHSGTPLY